ncbi:chromosome segregation protein [Halobacteriales archaeon SW_5_70_135]|nr:MAG: chromosome segregation protein [Halobacteriales archaeon SW_5_70_135]
MRFDRVRLRNFKPYADADLRLDRGVSVVLGPNGSGKSSLLQACFFALYGSKALEDVTLEDLVTRGAEETEVELWFTHDGDSYHVRRRVRTTGDRARTAECVLETPAGPVEGATAVRERVVEMLRMDADAFVNCAYVRQGEVNKLIHATPGERQDMIDDLLQLGTLETYRERAGQARLGVGDLLEGQREVAANLTEQIETKAEKNLHARLNELESERADVEGEIDRFEGNREQARETRDDARTVLDRHEEAREELADLESTTEDLREAVAETERERDELETELAETRERRSERADERADLLSDLDGDDLLPDADLLAPETADDADASADLPDPSTVALDPGADADAVGESLAAVETVADLLADRERDAATRVRELDGERERLLERATELASEVEQRREEADDLAVGLEAERATLAERRERLDDVDERIADLEARFEDAPVDRGEVAARLADLRDERDSLTEELRDLRTERDALAERIEEAESLLAEGRCPECGQPVEDSPHVDRLDDDRERRADLDAEVDALQEAIADVDERIDEAEPLQEAAEELDRLEANREDVEQLIRDKAESVADDEGRVEDRRERAAELDAEAERKREAAADVAERIEAAEERVAAVEDALVTVREGRGRVERAIEAGERVADLDDRAVSLAEERERLAELNDERRERLAELRERRDDLREEFDERTVGEAREELERAQSYLDDVEAKLEDLRERRDDLRERVGGVKGELRELENLREQQAAVERKVDALESLHGEVEELEATYGDLRADLRRRNVEVLERILNDTFDLAYGGDSYAGIELGDDYELTVSQKDGETLDPEQLSGGERALFNLSLRTAIYRLLAEGVEGTAPLPPLILDEPTVFLDSEHVSRLIDLVESMRDLGVEQIVVVTHDDELLGAADGVVTVRKDSTTNRSTVERSETVAPPAE